MLAGAEPARDPSGELGAGKTTLVRGIASGLGASEHVASPTFTLIREYVTVRIPIAHADVFLLDRVREVFDRALAEVAVRARALTAGLGGGVGGQLPGRWRRA